MSTDAQNTQQTAPGAQATYDLTLVVPCYNEADNIPLFYKTATECFENAGVKLEIVFVNDGSQDGLHGVAATCRFDDAAQKLCGAVLAAVVDEHDLKLHAGVLEAFRGRFVEQRDVVRLVVAGNHQRQVVCCLSARCCLLRVLRVRAHLSCLSL